MSVLGELNEEQRAAVEHVGGPHLVVAGAGTGKTRVITSRIAWLVENGHAKPDEILALTFTEKAAREMADRLYDLMGWQSFQVAVTTFNSFGAEIIGRFTTHIGRSTRGGLLNKVQKTLLLKQHIDEIQFEYYGPQSDLFGFLEGVVVYIEKLQNAGVTPEKYRGFVDGLSAELGGWRAQDIAEQRDLLAIYDLYEVIKQKTGTYDYSDQLTLALRVLEERPNLADRLRRQYRYVLVDEYQDTSPIQDRLLRSLVGSEGNIFAVGDDDQAIYGFRGADISNILAFVDHFKVPNPLALIQNYRSGQPILDAAYRLIKNNDPARLESRLSLDKRLRAQTDHASVNFVPYRTATDEQTGVVDEVASRLEDGQLPGEIAILARSNAVLRAYAKALRARGIPFALSTEVNIFEQRELISLWYVLAWLGGRASEESIAHVVLGPFFGWTPAAYRRIIERAKAGLLSSEEALRNTAESGDDRAADLVETLDRWRIWAVELPVSQLVHRLVFETGLSDRLLAAGTDDDRIIRVFEDLNLLMTQMQDYETVSVDQTLAGYLMTFPRPPALESTETIGDATGVQLLTVHASKGLEFDTVFVAGCTARAWSERTATGLVVPVELLPVTELAPEHEQRRLMYVAATRAKRVLSISAATETSGGQRQAITPLIEELLGHAPELPEKIPGANKGSLLQKLHRFYPLKTELPSRLPFETSDGWIELAVGALGLYQRCPHEFYLQHVLGISQPYGPQLAFGTALHGIAQAYYEAHLRREEIGLSELEAKLAELWSDSGYESRAQAEAAYKRAQETLHRFFEREESLKRTVLGSELKIRLELPEAKLRIRGRIDAFFDTPDGVEIRDFKTGGKSDPDKLSAEAKDNFQLRTYALAYQEMSGRAPAQVTLDYIVTGAEGSAVLSDRIMGNHRTKLVSLAERIRDRDFAPASQSEFHNCAAFTYYGNGEASDE